MQFDVKRAYDDPADNDGVRVLVDRLWPRGVKKEDLEYDAWLKELAPSSDARKDFNHEADKFPAFKKRYVAELDGSDEAAEAASSLVKDAKSKQRKKITLLYAAKDEEHNHAIILRDWLAENYG